MNIIGVSSPIVNLWQWGLSAIEGTVDTLMLHLAFGFPVSRLNLSQQQRTEAVLLSNFRMFNLNHSRCQLARSEESHSQNPEQQA